MKNIFNKLIKFSNSSIPSVVKASFLKLFGKSKNIEWIHNDGFYEAIFYLEEIEHIAHFDKSGKLINLKKNLPINKTPEHIISKSLLHGELMNVIEIWEQEIVGYELIIRDTDLIRFSLLINASGGIIQKIKL